MGKLKYSFIIPVYNCKEYLEECINSIRNQKNLMNYEIILVDDGSRDGSLEICEFFSKEYANIHTFHKVNGGASSARNYGIENAQGEYILFIDGDDTLDLELMSEVEMKNISDGSFLIYGMTFDYWNKGEIGHTEVLSYSEKEVLEINSLRDEFDKLFQCNSLSSACNKVFSRKVINDNNLRFDESMNLYEDFEFVLRYLQHVKRIIFIKEGYYHYRLQQGYTNLEKRISNLDRLTCNLKKVEDIIIKLNVGIDTYVKLYLQLMYLHLLYSVDVELSAKKMITEVQKKEWLKKQFSQMKNLGENETVLNQYILDSKKQELVHWIKRRRLVRNVKSVFRPMVQLLRRAITK